MRGDTAAGGRPVNLHRTAPFGDEALTLEEVAKRIDAGLEDTMHALLCLGAAGRAETDLRRWRLAVIEK